jgi:hypothetical protein
VFQISYIKCKPKENVGQGVWRGVRYYVEKIWFLERFNRSFRDEVLDANLFNSISQAQEAADAWVMDYNQFRPHDSLDDMNPMEFRSRAFKPGISNFGLST